MRLQKSYDRANTKIQRPLTSGGRKTKGEKMNDGTIEAEVIDTSKAIVVTRTPIIAYEMLKPISESIITKIAALNIESLEPTEENLTLIKRTRADLKKDFDNLENARKMAKEQIIRPYEVLDEQYKKLIAAPFTNADTQLKKLVDEVETGILTVKIDGLKAHFKEQNPFEFVKFEDMSLKIIKSKSDKAIKEEIDAYLATIKTALNTIETLPNKERVLAKFQMSKDLNRAISETNLEIQREEQIKAQNEARAAAANQPKPELIAVEEKPKEPIIEQPKIDDTVYQASFTVFATKAQLRKLKEFMKNEGVKYE